MVSHPLLRSGQQCSELLHGRLSAIYPGSSKGSFQAFRGLRGGTIWDCSLGVLGLAAYGSG